jgi:hypothetical protein
VNNRIIPVPLRLASAGAVIAALVHVTALAVPSFNDSTYSATYPWWRHVIFIGINTTLAWLLPNPPSWFIWPYALLTLQVLQSHGLGGFHEWQRTGHAHWIDVVSVIAVPLLLAVLVVERRRRAAVERSSRIPLTQI